MATPSDRDPGDLPLDPPAPSRDDVRYPRKTRDSGQRHRGARTLAWILVPLVIFGVQRLAEPTDPKSAPPVLNDEVGPAVRAYLTRIRSICRHHDRTIAATPRTTIHVIVQSETGVTSRIALLPTPSGAREIRRRLLAARRRVDEVAIKAYESMARSSDPVALYDRKFSPAIVRRSHHMYEIFGSFGVDCSTPD